LERGGGLGRHRRDAHPVRRLRPRRAEHLVVVADDPGEGRRAVPGQLAGRVERVAEQQVVLERAPRQPFTGCGGEFLRLGGGGDVHDSLPGFRAYCR
jgi:hypothetical protein